MKIYLIVVQAPTRGDSPWVWGAWDEWTIDENPDGYQEAINEARARNPSEEVRTACVEVPDGFLQQVFEPLSVKGKPMESDHGS